MQFYGNLSADAQVKTAKQSGKIYHEFTVIENQGKDANRSKTAYRVRAFNLPKDVVDQLTKGRRVLVKGTLEGKAWTGADGTLRVTLEVVTGLVEIQQSRAATGAGDASQGDRAPAPQSRPDAAAAPARQAVPAGYESGDDDDIPF